MKLAGQTEVFTVFVLNLTRLSVIEKRDLFKAQKLTKKTDVENHGTCIDKRHV